MEKNCIDLLQLQMVISEGVEAAVPGPVWVRAELSSVSVKRGGHCYMELSQSVDGACVAQARAVIWDSVYRQIAPCFAGATGTSLQAGQQLLLQVSARYNPVYGLSLIVNDIDPDYTLGDARRKRNETWERLCSEGLADMQKDLQICTLPRRIAVVSADTAAGYRDFMRHLHENAGGFRFATSLFEAPMQGAGCAAGIAGALGAIELEKELFDATVILRGGGGKLDLACYDEYEMCAAIARHPLPVITAIGHDQDTHLCDAVAFDAVKTPTALADWFLDAFVQEDARLWDLRQRLVNVNRTRIALLEKRLDVLKARLEAADPRRLLERGYALVVGGDGHLLKRAAGLKEGDSVTVMLEDGTVECMITKVSSR